MSNPPGTSGKVISLALDDDEGPAFKLKGKTAAKVLKEDTKALSALARMLRPKAAKAPRRIGITARGAAVRPSLPPQAQRCMVNFNFSKKKGAWRAVADYMEREGAQREGERGLSFGQVDASDGAKEWKDSLEPTDGIRGKTVVMRWKNEGDEHLFRVMLSPEFGHKANLRDMTRDFMLTMEKDLGTKLEWLAVDHYNTEHPHVHIAIRGKDQDGKSLKIAPEYIKRGARYRAQQWLTNSIGYRSERDMLHARSKEVLATRWTGLDTELQNMMKKHEVVEIDRSPRPREDRDEYLRQQQMLSRVKLLEEWGLATAAGANRWKLEPNAKKVLSEFARARDRKKKIYAGEAFLTNPTAPLATTNLKSKGQWVAGRVLGTGLDEAMERVYVLLEGIDGKVHYVIENFSREPDRPLKAGEFISLEVLEKRKGRASTKAIAVKNIQPGSPTEAALLDRYIAGLDEPMPPYHRDETFAGDWARKSYRHAQNKRHEQGLIPLPPFEPPKARPGLAPEMKQNSLDLFF